jgi:hypothetical protein
LDRYGRCFKLMIMSSKPSSGSFRSDPGHPCRVGVAAALAIALGASLTGARAARACSPPDPTAVTPTAIPRTGATDVSTASSFVIVSGTPPKEIALAAGGVDVPLTTPVLLSSGFEPTTGLPVGFWQVKAAKDFLPASSTLVLSAAGAAGARVTLTTIQTAAGYDKAPGTPATVKSLKLTRIRYPISLIGAGSCVFSEYVGFVELDVTPAAIPGTPGDSVVNTIRLAPRHGGAAEQTSTFVGTKLFVGMPGEVTLPQWMPHLDPTLEYCADIVSWGVGDLARLPVRSETVCTRVAQVDAPGTGGCAAGGHPDGSATALGLVALALIARASRGGRSRTR